MANGKTHSRYGKTTIVAVSLAALPFYNIWVVIGSLVGWLATPDLDMEDVITHDERRMYKMFKPLGALFHLYFIPYGAVFKHRSFWTHTPGIASAIRLAYMFWWVPLLIPLLQSHHFIAIVWVWIGVTIQDVVHLWLDEWRVFK